MKANEFLHKKDVAYMNRLSTSLDFDRIVSLMEEYAALRIHDEKPHNETTKTKIEEAAERRGFSAGLGERWEAEESFKAGAQFLLDAGVRFTREDMVEFAEWFSRNWDLDFKADQGLEVWRKEMESK